MKHWKPIKQNNKLRKIFPNPPIIAYKGNPSLRNKLVRAKLKPIEDIAQTNQETQPNFYHERITENYPYTIFTETLEILSKDVAKHVPYAHYY